jgi:hypothetical protein
VVRQKFLDYIIVSAEIPLPMESRINLQFFNAGLQTTIRISFRGALKAVRPCLPAPRFSMKKLNPSYC